MKRTFIPYSMSMVLFLVALSTSAEAVTRRSRGMALRHRSHLSLHLGAQERSKINDWYYYDGILTKYSDDDLVVSIGYGYFVDELTAFTVTVKVLEAETESFIGSLGVYNVDQAVVPIFFGVRRYLGPPRSHSAVRPYLALAGGPVIGSESLSLAGSDCYEETHTQAVVGAHFGGGIDFILGRHLTFGFNAGYNLMSDFDEPVAGHVNYSGTEFGVGIGFLF